jgi:hypothetical protein
LVAGLAMGTFVAYSNAIDDDGRFVLSFFIFMETLILIIIAVLFFVYSRKKS